MLLASPPRTYAVARTALLCSVLSGLLWTGLMQGCDPFVRDLGVVPPCARRILVERVTITPPPRLDLLLVVDDSSSMDDEQRALRREIPRLIRIFTSGDIDGDGLRDLLDPMPADVLDNTLFVWTSEMSEGGSHSNHNIPMVMIQGSEFDYFDAGRYLKWGGYHPISNFRPPPAERGEPMNKVLVSICNAMGLEDISSVGDPAFPAGPLERLR